MISINTNLSTGIAKNGLNIATLDLNKTIERLTTGFKINHASDNAANYSISNNYESKLSSYNIATDNIAEGMDLMTTAQDSLSIMEKLGTRLHALITQAQNGTYGEMSLDAINAEAAAIIAEIDRIYNSTEYNGIKLFNGSEHTPDIKLPEWVDEVNAKLDTSRYNGFIANAVTKDQSYIDGLQHVSELSSFVQNKEYQVSTKEDLEKLAELVNSGNSTRNVTFYLGADIDLEGATWIPIGDRATNSNYLFRGTFNGNGHVIKNFTINNSGKNYQGLFGSMDSNGTIKNLGIEDANVTGKDYTGILVGYSDGSITNCYTKGTVKGNERTGGIVGHVTKDVTDTYSCSTVSGKKYAGGLIGYATKAVMRCFTEGRVTTTGDYAGGLIGCTDGKIEECYSTANIKGNNIVSGIVGRTAETVKKTYSTGDADGYEFVGGVAGIVKKTTGSLNVDSILSTGHMTAVQKSGALLGGIENTAATRAPYNFSNVTVTNGYTIEQELDKIGGAYTTASGNAPVPYDITEWLDNVTYLEIPDPVKDDIVFQVGIHGNEHSSIIVNTSMEYDLSYLLEEGVQGEKAYDVINTFLETMSIHATEFGSISNRLESALDSVSTDISNITSSLSTIKDSDIGKLSAKFVRQQILQQASATLLATANQSPSIALQLI